MCDNLFHMKMFNSTDCDDSVAIVYRIMLSKSYYVPQPNGGIAWTAESRVDSLSSRIRNAEFVIGKMDE